MNISVPERPVVAEPSLEPYAQLLRALLPRMNSLSVFNALGELHWSTEISVEPALAALLPATIRKAEAEPAVNGEQCMAGSEPTYLFWLRRDDGAPVSTPFAVVAICFKPGNGDADLRAFSFVQQLVKPGIECLRRELMARDKILNLNSSLLEQDNDLDMLLSITGGTDNKPESAGDFKAIVARATEHLKVGLSALIVPEKGIALVQVSAESPIDTSLLAKAQMRHKATIVNRMVLTTGEVSTAYRVLVCPVLRSDGNTMGVLALFRTESAPEFTPHYARLTELLASRVSTIIGHSYDALTSLLTRPAFEQRVGGILQEGSGTQRCWSAVSIDINRMHVINDNYGMHMGDRVIAQLGELIRTRMPPGAIAARISGDRFAILLPASLDDAARFAEALRAGAEDLGAVFGDGKMSVSVSIGVSAVDPRSKEFVHAFAAAETACKAANDRGRNRVELYQEADEGIVRRFTDINLIADLRAAIAEDRLELNAQLIVPLRNHDGPPHFEILLRMIGENGEIVGPDHFMSAAHRYQLMPTLDRWVIKHALEMLKPHAELLRASHIVFAINFSGQSLQDADFTEHVARMIESSGLDPSHLCFELTA